MTTHTLVKYVEAARLHGKTVCWVAIVYIQSLMLFASIMLQWHFKDCKDVNVDMPCAWQPKRFDSVRLSFCSASSRTGISVVLEAS